MTRQSSDSLNSDAFALRACFRSSDVSERKSELVFSFANASSNRYKIDVHSTREIVQDALASRPPSIAPSMIKNANRRGCWRGRLAKTRSLYAFKTSAKK
eukprot:scaffold93394_cov23-Attheya_sp.AAC.1